MSVKRKDYIERKENKNMPLQLSMKFLSLILMTSVLTGCLNQIPVSEPSPTPKANRFPPADFSYSWTGGDENQPWTCSKITFKAEVSDPDGDKTSLIWHDNNNALFQFIDKSSFETKLWPDGLHTIKLTATDDKGEKTIVEKQINVKYEVPEPVPVKTKDGVNITLRYFPIGFISSNPQQAHLATSWSMRQYNPILGLYDITDPVTIDWHIKWALEHGINTLWIWAGPHGRLPQDPNEASYMVYYGDGFLRAKYKDRIRYNIFLDMRNYLPFDYYKETNPTQFSFDSIEKDFEILSKYYFNQPNYNRINGKPVVYLFGPNWYSCIDCENRKEREELLKTHIKSMRVTAKKYGYDLFLIGSIDFAFYHEGIDEFLIECFDALTSYNLERARDLRKYDYMIDSRGNQVVIAPYDDMINASIKRQIELFELAKKKGKVYIPFVISGFNNEKPYANTTYYA